MALRLLKTQAVIGLMITASHNQVSDNGVKIADPTGEMLTQEWEPFAESPANTPDTQHLRQVIAEFVKKANITLEGGARTVEILLGRDTRPSRESLLEAAKQEISLIVGATAIDMGIFTTPQLHWMVRAMNNGAKPSELDYFDQLSSSFRCLIDLIPQSVLSNKNDKLIVDGANGVGREKLEVLKKRLIGFDIDICNSGKEGELNDGVGADYVQKEKVIPCGFGPADVGIRQLTAYANGASTDYLKQMGLEVVFTPTGLKYLHEKAADYDVGINFEANGHGTILFSNHFLSWLEDRINDLTSISKAKDGFKTNGSQQVDQSGSGRCFGWVASSGGYLTTYGMVNPPME